jgi:hypothetical protein
VNADVFIAHHSYSSQIGATSNAGRVAGLSAIIDSAACSNTTSAPHEYFDLTSSWFTEPVT